MPPFLMVSSLGVSLTTSISSIPESRLTRRIPSGLAAKTAANCELQQLVWCTPAQLTPKACQTSTPLTFFGWIFICAARFGQGTPGALISKGGEPG